MPDADFTQLDDLHSSGGADAVFDWLTDTLRERKEYHKLFDVRLTRKKHSLGLPVIRPTSLEDVPDDVRKEFEVEYVKAAREVGGLLLADGDIPAAWMYLQVIHEPESVKAAIDKLPVRTESDEQSDEILRVALFEKVHPVKGVQMLLRTNGMCNTITSLDQVMPTLSAEDRRECARVMIRELYGELTETVRRHVQQKIPTIEPRASLKELITARDWLLADGNYHTDVSHLNSVVRFARSLDKDCEELRLAVELCEYGRKLDEPLRYPGEPPFEEFYEAHHHFFRILLDEDRDASLDYFRKKLVEEPDANNKPLLAYVLVDLLMRSDRLDDAVDVAAEHLTNLGEDVGFSFAELCTEAKAFDRLKETTQQKDDIVGYAVAVVQSATNR